jgi:hypothetical protein
LGSQRLWTVLALAAAVLAALAPPGRATPLADAPSLTHLSVQADAVRAWTDPDSAGVVQAVVFDARTRRWSRPAPWTPPAATFADSLGAVHVFSGGLFDQFPRASLALGDGWTLAHRDTGYALVHDADGKDYGWPHVSDEDIDKWGPQVRVGLPRDYPEDRLRLLLMRGLLKNEPGPTAVLGDVRWFGLKGGFTGGTGQMGGLIGFDPARGRFTVRRHFALVEASVTRLYARPGELWIGTARFGDNALEGTAGLILYRPDRNEWRQFSSRNSRISGDLVWDIAAAPDGLWVTTDSGVSLYSFARKNFSSWYWHVAKKGGGYELTDRPPGDLDTEPAQ